MSKKIISVGWAIVHKSHEVALWTNGGSRKLYTSKGAAKGALTQSVGVMGRDKFKVVEVFAEFSDEG